MSLQRRSITTFVFSRFRLDGGAMFGSAPKNIWEKKIPADQENCIPLAARSLIIRDADRLIVVDAGMGEKWTDKQRQIFGIQNTPSTAWPFAPEEVTDMILTHLHFDHAAGAVRKSADDSLVLTFPNARHYLQKSNLANARSPSPKEKASYLLDTVEPIGNSAGLHLLDGTSEIIPGIIAHQIDGHTIGQQWIEVHADTEKYFFMTDLVPTAHHLHAAFHMGYDACAATVLREKAEVLGRAADEGAILVFEHDPEVAAARIARDERTGFVVTERMTLAAGTV
jgi:glyoxylase-like metal-dependent hydrolase (beta-lactamase superfamily II)